MRSRKQPENCSCCPENHREDQKFCQTRQKPAKLDISQKILDIPRVADNGLNWEKRLEFPAIAPAIA
jgi:hypothetical protein